MRGGEYQALARPDLGWEGAARAWDQPLDQVGEEEREGYLERAYARGEDA